MRDERLSEQIRVPLTKAQKELLEKLARRDDRSVASIVRQALRQAVPEMVPAGEDVRYTDATGREVAVGPGFEHFVTGRARG